MLPVVTEEKSNTAAQKTKALTKKVAPAKAKPSATTGKKAMAVSPTKKSSVKTPVLNKRQKLDKTAGGSLRKSPSPLSKYKQKTPVGSLKKPLKRLQVSKCTPAQVRPTDMLIRKMEKEIVSKLSKKHNSSPYTLASVENSTMFEHYIMLQSDPSFSVTISGVETLEVSSSLEEDG